MKKPIWPPPTKITMTHRPTSLAFMRPLALAFCFAIVGCTGGEGGDTNNTGAAQTGGMTGNGGTGGGSNAAAGEPGMGGANQPGLGGAGAGGANQPGSGGGSGGGGVNQTGMGGGGSGANQPGSGGKGSGGMQGTGGMPGSGGGVAVSAEPAELKGITELHNIERRKVGVPDLTWDPALAAIAQAWASKCTDKDAPIGLVDHNPNRGVGYPGSVGENIFGSSATASAQQAVGSWVAELSSYDYAKNTCSGVCGHYTQVVWKTTSKVGCAVYKCANLKFGGTLVCDYSPAGNVNGQRPY